MTAPPRLLEGDELLYAVAGILLLHYALRPGQPVYLQRELEKIHVIATTEDVQHACRKLPRRGMSVGAQPRKPGYWLVDWLSPAMVWTSRSLLPAVATTDDKTGQLDGQN